MASFVYHEFKNQVALGNIDLSSTTTRQFAVLLVMTNTTVDGAGASHEDTISDLAANYTLDEMDGSGYTRTGLLSVTLTEDGANGRVEWDAADTVFTSINAGTRSVDGAIVFYTGASQTYESSGDGTNVPICFLEFSDFAANGGDITITWNAEGIVQVA